MRLLLGLLLLASVACSPATAPSDSNNSKGFVQGPPRPPPGAAESLSIGSEGGEVDLDGAKVNLPVGAIDETVEIVVSVDATYPEDEGGSSFSAVYEFQPDGITFNAPVRVELPFTGDAADAVIYWSSESDPDVFEPVETTIEDQRAVAYVSHFSRGVVRHRCLWPGSCACSSDKDCSSFGGLCSGKYYCDSSGSKTCVLNKSTVVNCSTSKTECVVNECNPASGNCEMVAGNEGSACDGPDQCTVSDKCESGVCKPGKDLCTECKKNSDCVDSDKNVCTGTYYCDLQYSFPYKCLLNPATVISCPDSTDTACKKNVCDPSSGDCAMVNMENGTACDDGDVCSGNNNVETSDNCQNGVCTPGPNFCECQKNSDCPDADKDLCTGVPYCDVTVNLCKHNPATVITCPTSNDTGCNTNTCAPSTGECAMVAKTGASCNDDDVCTAGTTCTSAGTCGGATSNPCECAKDGDCADPDNDVCTGVPYCNKEVSGPYECVNNPATVITCPSVNDTTCQENSCNATSGQCSMLNVNNGGSCNDGDPCTSGDACSYGDCVAGGQTCACTENADCNDDGNLCNGTPYCDKSAFPYACKNNPATVISCSSANDTACSQAQCIPGSGACQMVAINSGGACEADGQSCTADTCSAGACVAGPETSCVACAGEADCANVNCGGSPSYCSVDRCACGVPCQSDVDCKKDLDVQCDASVCMTDGMAAGYCMYQDKSDGSSCDLDGQQCSADTCQAGICSTGTNSCP